MLYFNTLAIFAVASVALEAVLENPSGNLGQSFEHRSAVEDSAKLRDSLRQGWGALVRS